MKKILFLALLLTASPLYAFEFMEKMDLGEMTSASGFYWAGPYKALYIVASHDNYGTEYVGIALNGGIRGIASYRKMDWFVMQVAIAAGKNVWLYVIDSVPNQWGYIAVGQKPPSG